jgi:AraC-like DNA-binding protein
MPSTTPLPPQAQWAPGHGPLQEQVGFLLWTPPEASLEREHEVLPDANVDLLLELSDGGCQALLHGPVTRTRHVPTRAGRGYLVVHFHMGAMPRLVDASPAELVDTAVPLRELAGVSLEELGARLHAASSLERMREVLLPLLARLPAPPRDTFDRALRHLSGHPSSLRPGALAEALHASPRTLQRAFHERLGLSPRTVTRILRLQEALAWLRAHPASTLAEAAFHSGYADHAHMTREFRELTGKPPSAFRPEGPAACVASVQA